jgi:acetyltransferase-like isoleucine patch superfamily enzyme
VIGNPLVTTPRITIGDEFLLWSTYRQTHLGGEGDGELIMGDRIFINTGAIILAYDRITFEDDVGIASEVFISDSDNHPLADRPMNQGPIHIGEGAWVATRAMIMPGVTIGPRAVIAAGSVVTKDVQAETLVAGIPARPIRKIEYPPGKRTAWKPT